MQADVIITVLKRWIEVLARLLLSWREHRRSQRMLMISEENGSLLVLYTCTDGRTTSTVFCRNGCTASASDSPDHCN